MPHSPRCVTLSVLLLAAGLAAQDEKPKSRAVAQRKQDAAVVPASLQVARSLAAEKFKGFVYTGKKPAPNSIDENAFVLATIHELASRGGAKLDAKATESIDRTLRLSGYSNKDVQSVFADAVKKDGKKVVTIGDLPDWTRGVQKAIVDAGLGEVVEAKDAKPGDLVQWWFQYRSGRWGTHVGIIETVGKGRAVIYGAHKSTLRAERKVKRKKGGIGSGPVLALADPGKKVYVVRFVVKNSPAAKPAARK